MVDYACTEREEKREREKDREREGERGRGERERDRERERCFERGRLRTSLKCQVGDVSIAHSVPPPPQEMGEGRSER